MSKRKKTESSIYDIYKSFSDLSLMTLGTVIFLFAIIVMTMRLPEKSEATKLKKEIEKLEEQLNLTEADKNRFKNDLEKLVITDPGKAVDSILEAAHVGKKDFELFIKGLDNIPGKDIHLVVDATGSMHGISGFLVPLLRVIINRSGKKLSAITWFSDANTKTYTGTMGDMFDHLITGAPFTGSDENIGHAFHAAVNDTPLPGAYMLIGDEGSTDTIQYNLIPRPVFTLPLGVTDPDLTRDYGELARKTGGKMLQLDFR